MSKNFESVMGDWLAKRDVHLSGTGEGRLRDIRRQLDSGSIDTKTAVSNFLAGEKHEKSGKFTRNDIEQIVKDLR